MTRRSSSRPKRDRIIAGAAVAAVCTALLTLPTSASGSEARFGKVTVAQKADVSDPYGPGRIDGQPRPGRVTPALFGMAMEKDVSKWPALELGVVRLTMPWRVAERSPGVYDPQRPGGGQLGHGDVNRLAPGAGGIRSGYADPGHRHSPEQMRRGGSG